MKYVLIAAAILTIVGATAASAQRFEGGREGFRRCEFKRGELRRAEFRAREDGRISYRERLVLSELRREVRRACDYR